MTRLNPIFHWAETQYPPISLLFQLLPASYGKLVEFYTGAGHVFLHFQPERLIINDFDAKIMSSYKLIRDYPYEFIFYNRDFDRPNIINISQYLNLAKCQIFSVHYKELAALINSEDFIFIDQSRSYYSTDQDNLELLAFLNNTGAKWLIFQPSTPFILNLYKDYNIVPVDNLSMDFLFIYNYSISD